MSAGADRPTSYTPSLRGMARGIATLAAPSPMWSQLPLPVGVSTRRDDAATTLWRETDDPAVMGRAPVCCVHRAVCVP